MPDGRFGPVLRGQIAATRRNVARWTVVAYEQFAPFYDAVMDDPGPRAARVNSWIERYRPDARSVLEVGCGTGSILVRLTTTAALTGLDRSPEMLAIAARKIPDASFVEADMASFSIGRRFDVVLCIFDSINHLLTLEEWRSFLGCAHDHLAEGGLFVFDVNTIGELRRLGDEPPWVYEFDGGTAIIDVAFAEDDTGSGSTDWDIRIFEQVGGARYVLHRESIGELAVPLARVRELIGEGFDLLEEVDDDGGPATDASVKAYYALRRRERGST